MPFPLNQPFCTGSITATGTLLADNEWGGLIYSGASLYFATIPTSSGIYYGVGSLSSSGGVTFTSGTGFTTGTYANVPTTGGLGFGAHLIVTCSGGHVLTWDVMATGRGQYYTTLDLLGVTITNGSGFTVGGGSGPGNGGWLIITNSFTLDSYGSSATTGVGGPGSYLMSNITSSASNPFTFSTLTTGYWMLGGLTQPVNPTNSIPPVNTTATVAPPIVPNLLTSQVTAQAPFGVLSVTIPPLPFPFSGAGGGTVGTPI